MSLERYLKTLNAAFRNQDGRSMARCFSANAKDVPSGKEFVPYLQEVTYSQ